MHRDQASNCKNSTVTSSTQSLIVHIVLIPKGQVENNNSKTRDRSATKLSSSKSMIMTTDKVVGEYTVPCVGASNDSKSMAATNEPQQRGGSRKDMSTIKEGNNLPRTGAASNTRLSQTAIINQKLMNTYYLMSKFYQVRKRINMISLFEHYKDVTATPRERLTIESFRVPSKPGYGYKVRVRKMESNIPSKIGVGRMGPNHNYVKLPETVPVETSVARHVERSPPSKGVVEVIDSGRSNDNNYTAGMLPTEDRGKNKVEEEDDNPFNKSTSNSNNTTDIATCHH